jgi:hypothetical protein
MLGLSEEEIRAAFPAELARLASTLGTDVDGAVAELARWHCGYSFDGATSSFHPLPMLAALRAGTISERELGGEPSAALGADWLRLTPGVVMEGLAQELQNEYCAKELRVNIAEVDAQRVHVVPLLQKMGLLSIVAGQPTQHHAPNEYARRSLQRMQLAPNEYARCSLQRMVSHALQTPLATLAPFAAALRSRDRAAFSMAVTSLLEKIPRTIFQREGGVNAAMREAAYQAALFAALVSSAPDGVYVQIKATERSGRADIILRFTGPPHPAAWAL